MDARHLRILDVKIINDATGQSVAVEFGDGGVRTFSAQELYDASRSMGQAPPDSGAKTASQRRAEEFLAARRGGR